MGINPRALGTNPRERHAAAVILRAAGVCEICGTKAELQILGCRIGDMLAVCPRCGGAA